jgi:SAM-dependent methyltransferase
LVRHALPAPLPFDDKSFDGAYAIALLMHLPEESIDPSLLKFARVIRPGGRFLFSIPDLRKDPITGERDAHGGQPCPGTILVQMGKDDVPKIHWECPICDDGGNICNWQGTYWDISLIPPRVLH